MNMQYLQEEYMFDEFILKTTSQNISYNTMFYYINNLLASFFIIFSSLFTGLFLGFGLVAFMYNPEWNTKTAASSLLDDSDYDVESTEEDDDSLVEDYELKYLQEFRALTPRELSSEELKALRLKSVKESITDEYDETIKREVIMTYNSDTESFWYYTDQSTKISYMMLNTLARLFTITYDCKNLYLGDIIIEDKSAPLDDNDSDYSLEDENANAPESNANGSNAPIESVIDANANSDINVVQEDTIMLVKSIFAKFKSYNKEPAKPIITTTTSSGKQQTQQAKAQNVTNDIKNQFKYKGKLIEYVSFTESNESNEIKKDENVTKMDYASFKKQFILNNDNNNTSSL